MDADVDRGLPLLCAGAPPLPALWGYRRVGLAPVGLEDQGCPSSAGGDGRLPASLSGRYRRRIRRPHWRSARKGRSVIIASRPFAPARFSQWPVLDSLTVDDLDWIAQIALANISVAAPGFMAFSDTQPPGGGPGPAPAPGRWPHRAHAQDGVGGWHASSRLRAAHAARETRGAHPTATDHFDFLEVR